MNETIETNFVLRQLFGASSSSSRLWVTVSDPVCGNLLLDGAAQTAAAASYSWCTITAWHKVKALKATTPSGRLTPVRGGLGFGPERKTQNIYYISQTQSNTNQKKKKKKVGVGGANMQKKEHPSSPP